MKAIFISFYLAGCCVGILALLVANDLGALAPLVVAFAFLGLVFLALGAGFYGAWFCLSRYLSKRAAHA